MITTTEYTRTIDDLGRIAIPKEFRRELRIREGDELKISHSDGKLIIEKFSPFDVIKHQIKDLLDAATKTYGRCFIVTDRSKVILTTERTQALQDENLHEDLVNLIHQSDYSASILEFTTDGDLYIDESKRQKTNLAFPIRCNGRIFGVLAAVGVSNSEQDYYATKTILRFIEVQLDA